MNDQQRAAMQMALDLLEELADVLKQPKNGKAITALREALAEPDWEAIGREQLRRYKEKFGDFEQAEQSSKAATPTTLAEPVAWWHPKMGAYDNNYFDAMQPLYLSPARTKDLTDDEISDVFDSVGSWKETLFGDLPVVFARAVIAADREKNK
jgi:hypothetical protein